MVVTYFSGTYNVRVHVQSMYNMYICEFRIHQLPVLVHKFDSHAY